MTIQDKATALYRSSDLFITVEQELANGCSADDNHFIQGVYDSVFSVLSKHFSEDEMEEVEVGELLDTCHL